MRFNAFFGGSYENKAVTADTERLVNWFVENLESKGATKPRVLLPTPGVEIVATRSAQTPGRAHYAIFGREFCVIGNFFFEIGRDGAIIASLQVTDDGKPATISCNGDGGGQLFVTSGGNGYLIPLTWVGAAAIPALAGKAYFGGHLDGYFLALDTTTSTLYASELYDGATWTTGSMKAQRSLAPDKWVSMQVAGRAVWMLGEQTSEVWYNTGDRFPLSPLANQVVPFGILAPWSAKMNGSDISWLGVTSGGKVCVLRASSLNPEVVSTYPLEGVMQEYTGRTQAVADAYSDAGHSFYLLNFDRDNATWCFDSETRLWHERGTWVPESNRYASWRPRFYAQVFGEHRMLDTSNGNIYRMSSDLTRDVDGRKIRRLRRAPGISEENKRLFYSELELELEPGVGIQGCQVGFTMAELPLAADFTILEDGGTEAEPFSTFTPTVVGGSGDYSYAWSGWSEQGGSEEAPAFTSTEEVGQWQHSGLCFGFVKLVVTDNVTSSGVTVGGGGTRPFSSWCA